MSVRIYQLSKKIGMENNDLIELLSQRGFQVKSASSSIDNISADSIIEEFSKKTEPAAEAEKQAAAPLVEEKKPVAPPSPNVFVRSKKDVEQEKKAAAPPPVKAAPLAAPRTAPPVKSAPSVPRPAVAGTPSSATPPSPSGPVSPPVPKPPSASPAGVSIPSTKKTGGVAVAEESGDGIRTITLKPPIVVRDLATELGLKPFKLISELMEMGIFASINQSLEEDVASKIAEKHSVILEIRHRGEGPKQKKKKVVAEVDESKLLEERPAVVCILGHVDHGKTSLLDYIRKANVVSGEAGGITQHIGAYQVEHKEKKITFLDTPGHAAFNAMRARGADVTDVAILIVAADDGFMPQTDEALKFLQEAGVQPIVAINKIDTAGANIDKVKQQMQERGIASEDWGGEIITSPISALKGDGVEELLEMIQLQAEILELKANPKKAAEGIIIEAQMEVGRGPTATVIVQSGTLKIGDSLVCGPTFTKVKAMFNEHGQQLKVAPPSTPVRVIGWSDTPDCGATFVAVKNEKTAKREAEENRLKERDEAQVVAEGQMPTSQEKLFAAIAKTQSKILRLIIKGDVFGSVEAVVNSLEAIESDKVSLEIIHADVGAVSKSDVQKASAGDASIIGFNVKNENGVMPLAKHHQVKIVHHPIIYELIDQVRDDMVNLLDPEYRENKIGAAEVRAVFPISNGTVAGCLVTEGRVEHDASARVVRRNDVVFEGKIDTLRRVKDDVKEVRAGTECGIRLKNCNDYKEGDTIEVFEVHEIRPSL